jgi:hypothetical protein
MIKAAAIRAAQKTNLLRGSRWDQNSPQLTQAGGKIIEPGIESLMIRNAGRRRQPYAGNWRSSSIAKPFGAWYEMFPVPRP